MAAYMYAFINSELAANLLAAARRVARPSCSSGQWSPGTFCDSGRLGNFDWGTGRRPVSGPLPCIFRV